MGKLRSIRFEKPCPHRWLEMNLGKRLRGLSRRRGAYIVYIDNNFSPGDISRLETLMLIKGYKRVSSPSPPGPPEEEPPPKGKDNPEKIEFKKTYWRDILREELGKDIKGLSKRGNIYTLTFDDSFSQADEQIIKRLFREKGYEHIPEEVPGPPLKEASKEEMRPKHFNFRSPVYCEGEKVIGEGRGVHF